MKFLGFYCIAFTLLSGCLKRDLYEGDKDKSSDTELPDLGVPNTFDWNEAYISIPLANIDDIDKVIVDFPTLKYNKRFVYSYTFDDDVVQAYGKAFCTINQKWVDNEKFFHVGQTKTTGITPLKTLGYTDGCGIEKRFTFGVAIWPNSDNLVIDNLMAPTNKKPDKSYPYLVWKDLVPILDFGSDIYFHNIGNRIYDKDNLENIVKGLEEDQKTTISKINRSMKILMRPDGNNSYITAGRKFDDIVFMSGENSIDDGSEPLKINFTSIKDLYKQTQFRRYTEPIANANILMTSVSEAALSGQFVWLHDFSHAPSDFQYILDLFSLINDNYGKDGDDSVWFASVDEIYEYINIRMNSYIVKSVSGENLIIKIAFKDQKLLDRFQYHRDFSFVISGVKGSNIKIGSGKNVFGLSYQIHNNDCLLVNVNCNSSLLDKAERYTKIVEKEHTQESKNDALYFINQLKEDLRSSFLVRCK